MTRGFQTPAESASGGHRPVMLEEVLSVLEPRDGGTYVDGTFGAGGYSRAMLEIADCSVWALDRDPDSIARGAIMARDFPGRLHVKHGRFGDMADLFSEAPGYGVDGVALDLGLSSLQLDARDRGFAFRFDGPLDMRMDPTTGQSAAEVVNTLPEKSVGGHSLSLRRRAWISRRCSGHRACACRAADYDEWRACRNCAWRSSRRPR